jgi:lipid-A-disaccharide synthase
LELALCSVPTVVAYRIHPVSAFIVRRLMTVRYANLVNWLLDREAVPEFLQEQCRGDLLAYAVSRLITHEENAAEQKEATKLAMSMLAPPDGTSSDAAAAVVLHIGKNVLENRD